MEEYQPQRAIPTPHPGFESNLTSSARGDAMSNLRGSHHMASWGAVHGKMAQELRNVFEKKRKAPSEVHFNARNVVAEK